MTDERNNDALFTFVAIISTQWNIAQQNSRLSKKIHGLVHLMFKIEIVLPLETIKCATAHGDQGTKLKAFTAIPSTSRHNIVPRGIRVSK